MDMLLFLVASHFLCDYTFQNDFMARFKNRNVKVGDQKNIFWPYLLTAHAVTHAVAVGLITQNVWIGVVEFVVHWVIDFCKCEEWISLNVDQSLHVINRVLFYFAFLHFGSI